MATEGVLMLPASSSAPERRKVMLAQRSAPGRSRPQDIDRHVGARMRERRIMLGLTQQQMAELIGVTYKQAHKYEKGINRVAAGRLYSVAQSARGRGQLFL